MKTWLTISKQSVCIFIFSSFLTSWSGTALADSESQAAELKRLRNQIEELQKHSEELRERSEKQKQVIKKISKKLEKLEASDKRAVSDKTFPQKVDVDDSELELVAGKGAPDSGATATSPGSDDGEVVKEARPSKSVENILREEHTLFDRRLTIEPSVSYAYSDRRQVTLSGFLALDAIFLGNISVDTVKSHITTFDLTTRYGFTDRLEAEFTAPFLYRSTDFQSGGVGGAASSVSEATVDEANIGDVNGTIYYRLFRETQKRPDIVWNVGFKAPTGKDPFGIPTVTDPTNTNLNYPADLPTGNGAWAITSGFSFLKTIDPAIVFANIGYTYNFENSFDDINANPGAQPGDVDLGDSVRFGFGTAFALNERFSLSLSYAQQLTFKTDVQQVGQPEQEVVGSNANVATANIGATYALTDKSSLVTNLGIGLTNDASDVTVTFRLPMQF